MTQRGEQVTLQEANLQYLIEEVERRSRREGSASGSEQERPVSGARPMQVKPANKR